MRAVYTIIGMFIGAFVDLLINILASVITQQPFVLQRLADSSSVGLLIALIAIGLLVGFYLGGRIQVPANPSPQTPTGKTQPVTITRLHALFSYGQLKGKGIHLSDILLIGSRIDIDTRN